MKGVVTFRLIGCIALIGALTACGGPGSISIFSPGAVPPKVVFTPPPTSGTNPPTPGTPTFPIGGSGDCKNGIYFTGIGQTATVPLSETNYTGTFTATSNLPSSVSVSVSGSNMTLTALANGTIFVTIKDQNGNSNGCNISVTLTNGTVS